MFFSYPGAFTYACFKEDGVARATLILLCQANIVKSYETLNSETMFFINLHEVNHMAKSRDTKKDNKKKPQKSTKEKKQAKREKKSK